MEPETTTLNKKEIPADDDVKQKPEVKETSPTTPSGGSWWGGWISQAKEKSASVLEAVKNDLNEITSAVTETFHIAPTFEDQSEQPQTTDDQQQSNTVNYMKQSLSSFFGQVTDALIPQFDEDDATEAVLITSNDAVSLTGYAKHLAELQGNDETYLEEPSKTEELAEKYRMWLEVVEQDQFTQQRITKMLESSQILNEKYNKFVPETVSHMNFFKRYLFKKALMEDELANAERKQKDEVIEKEPEPLVEEPTPQIQTTQPKKTDIDDMEIANFELSEEEQARLLEEYEQEIKEREKTKKDPVEEPKQSSPKSKSQSQKSTKAALKSTNVPGQVKAPASGNGSAKGKNNKNVRFQQQQKSTQHPKVDNPAKLKAGDELKMDKDHYKESESSTSDESWEKEFDL